MGGHAREQAREQQGTHDSPAKPIEKKPVGPQHIAIAPVIDLGDLEVGKHVFVDVPIFNLDLSAQAGASVHLATPTRLDGTKPEIVLISAPERVRPSREGSLPDQQIRLRFEPPAEGHYETSLTVTLAWQLGGPEPETVVVPVRGAGHAPGTSSLEERAKEAKERSELEQEKRALDRKLRDNSNAVGSHLESRDTTNITNRFQTAYKDVFDNRVQGIDAAAKSALNYRRIVRHEPSLAKELAMIGIELATGIISAGVGAAVEAALFEAIEVEVISKVAAEAVKDGVKVGLTPREASTIEITPTHDAGAIEFFLREEGALANGEYEAMQAATSVADLFIPLFDRNPHVATKLSKAAADAIAASADHASAIQEQQSSEQWVRYVAHTSLGGRQDDKALTAVENAGQAPTAEGPTRWFDGLVDISFTASTRDPRETAAVASARLTGIGKNTVALIAREPLLDSPIPIRATGAPTENEAVLSLAVTRNEAMELSFTDQVGVPWMPSHWFERKGDGDAREGAKRLLADLLAQPLGGKLESDDVS
jgi:hypothetical protein